MDRKILGLFLIWKLLASLEQVRYDTGVFAFLNQKEEKKEASAMAGSNQSKRSGKAHERMVPGMMAANSRVSKVVGGVGSMQSKQD